ncbi:MAG: 30S ribosomal protein S20 [Candidatus Eisenbacteria bacterium]|nr:30S ribosomal protein S20 [Candidatus Latescibacterota bacterium]MBD3301833.1 30S ribosomal protein S20 [Candidatus Eisenbacteria bacterium]
MPHHKSTEKRMRTNERDRRKNIAVRSEVRSAIRRFRANVGKENASELLRKAESVLDNAVRKGVLHARTSDRQKSRLAKAAHKAASSKS